MVLELVQNLQSALILFTISLLVFSFLFRGTLVNIVFGQAVPLIPLTSGNATLDTGIPKFYKCIEKEVRESKNINDDPYFKSEPTKAEVFKCYSTIFRISQTKDGDLN
jgi:hypothetical protein